MNKHSSLVELSDVSFKDLKTNRLVLKDITLSIKEAEILTIIGPNGAEKPRLLS